MLMSMSDVGLGFGAVVVGLSVRPLFRGVTVECAFCRGDFVVCDSAVVALLFDWLLHCCCCCGVDGVVSCRGDEAARRTKPLIGCDIRLLIAEDNLVNQKILTRILKKIGVTNITVVDNGKKALDECKSNEYDVVLLDMQMPVMDGLEACRLIRQEDDGDGLYTVRIHQTPFERDADWHHNQLPRILTGYHREGIHYFVKPGRSDQHLPGVFRHSIGIRDDMIPDDWKDLSSE